MKRFMTISQHNRPPHHAPRVIVSLLLAALSLMLIACGDDPEGDISLAEFHNRDTRIITFHKNGGAGDAPSTIVAKRNHHVTLPNQGNLALNGHVFAGWKNNRGAYDRTSTTYAAGYSFVLGDGDGLLYADWRRLYTITFNANGGTSLQPVTSGEGMTITIPTGSRNGYTLNGWNTRSDGNGTNYNAGLSYTVTGDVTLYAKWTPTNYTITYNLGGGSVSATNPPNYNITSTITLNIPTKTGYTFAGWTGSNGTTPQTTVTIPAGSTGNKTYTANWTPISYSITYDVNGGNGTTPSPQTADFGSSITLHSGNDLSRSGYTFGGWNTNSDGTGTNYNAGASYEVTGDVTLYANWSMITYTLTVHAGTGGTVSPLGTSTRSMGTEIQVCATPSSGYTFSGWSGASTSTSSCVTVTMNGDRTLTANFLQTYTLTVNAGPGGSVTPSGTSTRSAGTEIQVCAHPSSGYTFSGWSGASTSTSSCVTVTMSQNRSLTANFQQQPTTYTLTVHAGTGGTVSPSGTSTRSAGTSVTVTATAASGYRFIGWSDGVTSASRTVTMSSNVTLTANFEPSLFNPNINYGSFTDSRDGKSYRTIVIGTQTWMAENLNYQTTSGSYCYGNQSSNCDRYGRLYTWAAARASSSSGVQGVCPAGWHLPSDAEWTVLVNAVGSSAGTKLKSTSGWNSGGNGTDDFGFSALPGGRYYGGNFDYAGYNGNWWSATVNGVDNAWGRGMDYNANVVRSHWYTTNALSVRCVRD